MKSTLDITVNLDIAVSFEQDESGQVTAYNDDLRIMAVGEDEAAAEAAFRAAVVDWLRSRSAQSRTSEGYCE